MTAHTNYDSPYNAPLQTRIRLKVVLIIEGIHTNYYQQHNTGLYNLPVKPNCLAHSATTLARSGAMVENQMSTLLKVKI